MRRLIGASRYIILLAVAGAFVMAVALFIYGAVASGQFVVDLFSQADFSAKGIKPAVLGAIKLVDLLLLGTVVYITALGLYELFIDDQIPLPDWLEIRTLDHLKYKLVGVVVVILSVFFLEQTISWDGNLNLLVLGVSIAAIIAALRYFIGDQGH